MKIAAIILALAVFCSCDSLPKIIPVNSSKDSDYFKSYNPFLKEKYRLIHSIRAGLPNGDIISVIGITVSDPNLKSIHAVLMTIEGFILFNAFYKKNNISITLGIPPFDSMNFATALIEDIKLFYFTPDGVNTESGKVSDAILIKRYRCNDEITIDVISDKDKTGTINKYDCGYSLVRAVNLSALNNNGLPVKIELTAHGFFGYSLSMELIESEKISQADIEESVN